jgi:Flp pilus assembly protein TadB
VITIAAAVLAALAVWAWPVRVRPTERLRAILGSSGPHGSSSGDERVVLLPGLMVAAPAGMIAFLVVGGLPGAVAGVMVTGGVLTTVGRREPAGIRRRRERINADLPFAADLMAACLRAGQPLSGTIDVTAEAVAGPLGDRLAWAGAQGRLGADPEEVWGVLAEEPPLASLARAMIRAAQNGAPVADALTRLADDARHAARAASSAAARKVGVQAVAPLGLCFLPAFVVLGVVPVVAGLASQILLP